jgi:hypothetical protein
MINAVRLRGGNSLRTAKIVSLHAGFRAGTGVDASSIGVTTLFISTLEVISEFGTSQP